ncbi:protein of unknown function [Hyphomicrobium sp. 1Nfss2.1]
MPGSQPAAAARLRCSNDAETQSLECLPRQFGILATVQHQLVKMKNQLAELALLHLFVEHARDLFRSQCEYPDGFHPGLFDLAG